MNHFIYENSLIWKNSRVGLDNFWCPSGSQSCSYDSMASPHPLPTTSHQLNNLGQSLTFSGSKFLKCKREVKPYPPLGSRPECLSSSECSQGEILYQLWVLWKNFIFYNWIQFGFHTPRLHGVDGLPYPILMYSLQYRDSFLFDSSLIASVQSSIPFPEDSTPRFLLPTPSPLPGCTGSRKGVEEPVPLESLYVLPAEFSFPCSRKQSWCHILLQ